MEQALRDWVEQVGLWAETQGMTRSTGRVLGWLLVCDPPEASAAELAAGLDASTGSISAATRLLVSSGLVERVAVAGERRTYHRVTPQTLTGLLSGETARILRIQQLGEDGLEALAGEGRAEAVPAERAARLRAWTGMAAFFAAQWPTLLAQWEEQQ